MKPENTKCPNCDGPMISRKNSKTGQVFWGCKDFPKCKGTRDTDGMSRAERAAERGEDFYEEEIHREDSNSKFQFKKS